MGCMGHTMSDHDAPTTGKALGAQLDALTELEAEKDELDVALLLAEKQHGEAREQLDRMQRMRNFFVGLTLIPWLGAAALFAVAYRENRPMEEIRLETVRSELDRMRETAGAYESRVHAATLEMKRIAAVEGEVDEGTKRIVEHCASTGRGDSVAYVRLYLDAYGALEHRAIDTQDDAKRKCVEEELEAWAVSSPQPMPAVAPATVRITLGTRQAR